MLNIPAADALFTPVMTIQLFHQTHSSKVDENAVLFNKLNGTVIGFV